MIGTPPIRIPAGPLLRTITLLVRIIIILAVAVEYLVHAATEVGCDRDVAHFGAGRGVIDARG